MSSINLNMDNIVNITGRIKNNPTKDIYENKDGSRRIYLTLSVQNPYNRVKGGRVGSQSIRVKIFVPANDIKIDEQGREKYGIFSTLRTGDMINIFGHLENTVSIQDGSGMVVVCDSICYREPKKKSDVRAESKTSSEDSDVSAETREEDL